MNTPLNMILTNIYKLLLLHQINTIIYFTCITANAHAAKCCKIFLPTAAMERLITIAHQKTKKL